MSDSDNDKPIWFVSGGLVVLILVLGWGAMASDYANSGPDMAEATRYRGRGMGMFATMVGQFAWNGLAYLPEFFSVIRNAFQNSIAIPVGMGIAILAVIALTFWMKSLETDLADPSAAYRKRRDKQSKRRKRRN